MVHKHQIYVNFFSTVSIYYFSPDEEEEPLAVKVKAFLIEYLKKSIEVFCVWDCCWLWVKITHILELIVFDPFMELFITLCIAFNTLFMAMDHHDMSPGFERFLELGNYVSALFICKHWEKILLKKLLGFEKKKNLKKKVLKKY